MFMMRINKTKTTYLKQPEIYKTFWLMKSTKIMTIFMTQIWFLQKHNYIEIQTNYCAHKKT